MPTRTCEYCSNTFEGRTTKSRFCSRDCIVAYTAKINLARSKKKICPHCGHRGYRPNAICFRCTTTKAEQEGAIQRACPRCGFRSYRKATLCLNCKSLSRSWTKTEDKIIATLYPSKGAQALLSILPTRTYTQIRDRAYKLGVVLSKKAYRRTVHAKAAEHMRLHNPSQQPGATERLREQSKATWNRPDVVKKTLEGQRKAQKGKPTKLELKLFAILDSLGITYESYVVVKPKFIVDVRIGNAIIQADGDWWHGHVRFYPLMARQHKQQLRDRAQDKYLEACGYTVIRIWESDMSPENVITALTNANILYQPPLIVL